MAISKTIQALSLSCTHRAASFRLGSEAERITRVLREAMARVGLRQAALRGVAARLRKDAAALRAVVARDTTFYKDLRALQGFWKVWAGGVLSDACHANIDWAHTPVTHLPVQYKYSVRHVFSWRRIARQCLTGDGGTDTYKLAHAKLNPRQRWDSHFETCALHFASSHGVLLCLGLLNRPSQIDKTQVCDLHT